MTENSSFAELANQRRASHTRTLLLCSIFYWNFCHFKVRRKEFSFDLMVLLLCITILSKVGYKSRMYRTNQGCASQIFKNMNKATL